MNKRNITCRKNRWRLKYMTPQKVEEENLDEEYKAFLEKYEKLSK